MPHLKTKPPDVMRAAAGFHCNHTRLKHIQKVQQPMSLETFAKHDHSCFVQPGETANGLAQMRRDKLDEIPRQSG